MWKINNYILNTWLLGVGILLPLSGLDFLMQESDLPAAIGDMLSGAIPFGIAALVFSSPSILFSYAMTDLLFRFRMKDNERFAYSFLINQVAVWMNISLFTLLFSSSFPEFEFICLFWPAFAAAFLAGLFRYRQFYQLIQDKKNTNHDNDLV